MAWKHLPHNWPFVRGITFDRWIPLVKGHYDETLGVIMDKLLKTKQSDCRWFVGNDLRRHDAPWRHWNLQPNPYFKDVNWNINPMHIWNRPWPFIYEIHNRLPMLLSATFDEIATLVWNFDWAHKFVARWIRCSCVYFYLWPLRFVAVPVCGRSGLWPFRFVAVPVCGRFGLWPFRFVAVSVCGLSGLWPFRFVAVSVCGRLGFGRFSLWPLWPESLPITTHLISDKYDRTYRLYDYISLSTLDPICQHCLFGPWGGI